MAPKLLIRILSSELPLDGSLFGVMCLLPGVDFGLQELSIGNVPIQALTAEDADLNFRQVHPARVLGHLMELNAAQELVATR